MMELQVSPRVMARLVVALTKPKLSPVAEAASKHEPRLRSLIVKSAKATRELVPMRELEGSLIFGGSGAPLYVLEDALKAWERALLGDGVEAAPTDWIKMRSASAYSERMKAANKKDLPSVLHSALQAGANSAEVCVVPQPGQLNWGDTKIPTTYKSSQEAVDTIHSALKEIGIKVASKAPRATSVQEVFAARFKGYDTAGVKGVADVAGNRIGLHGSMAEQLAKGNASELKTVVHEMLHMSSAGLPEYGAVAGASSLEEAIVETLARNVMSRVAGKAGAFGNSYGPLVKSLSKGLKKLPSSARDQLLLDLLNTPKVVDRMALYKKATGETWSYTSMNVPAF